MDETGPQPADRTRDEASRDALSALQWNWGEAYEIEAVRDIWRPRRLDGLGGWITARGPEELGQEISDDYALKRVPRDAARGPR